MLTDIKIEIKKEGRLIISLYQAARIRSLMRYNAHSILMSEGGQGTVRCSKVSPLIANRSWTTTIEVNMGYSPFFFSRQG